MVNLLDITARNILWYLMAWPAWPAGTVPAASGAVSCSLYTLRLAIPHGPRVCLHCRVYSLALNMDMMLGQMLCCEEHGSVETVKVRHSVWRMEGSYEPRSPENPSISLPTHGPKRNRKSWFGFPWEEFHKKVFFFPYGFPYWSLLCVWAEKASDSTSYI